MQKRICKNCKHWQDYICFCNEQFSLLLKEPTPEDFGCIYWKSNRNIGRMARHKGGNYERSIAKLFTKSLQIGEIKRRGFETGKGRMKPPDLEFPDGYKRFDDPNGGIECKKVEDWSFDSIIYPQNQIFQWLKEYKEKYKGYDNFMLICSKNHYPNLIIMSDNTFEDVKIKCENIKNGLSYSLNTEKTGWILSFKIDSISRFYVLELNDFLSRTYPNFFTIKGNQFV